MGVAVMVTVKPPDVDDVFDVSVAQRACAVTV
jgi:hypothetical protein